MGRDKKIMSRKIGALWIREKDGKKYMSGVLNDLRGDINIAVFKNDRKEKENQPDYHIIISERPQANKPIREVSIDEPPIETEIPIDDLPF